MLDGLLDAGRLSVAGAGATSNPLPGDLERERIIARRTELDPRQISGSKALYRTYSVGRQYRLGGPAASPGTTGIGSRSSAVSRRIGLSEDFAASVAPWVVSGADLSLRVGDDLYVDLIARMVSRTRGLDLPAEADQPYTHRMLSAVRGVKRPLRVPDYSPGNDSRSPLAGGPAAAAATGGGGDAPSLEELLRTPIPRIGRFSGNSATRFDERMRWGEEALREGRYFDAERHFSLALIDRPREPLATIAKVHAQIGAGLHHSAALTLHRLYVIHPELVGLTFEPSLIPARDRLLEAGLRVTQLLANDNWPQAGMLLAYIGRLAGRTDLVITGLDDMAADRPDDPLLPILRQAWLLLGQYESDSDNDDK